VRAIDEQTLQITTINCTGTTQCQSFNQIRPNRLLCSADMTWTTSSLMLRHRKTCRQKIGLNGEGAYSSLWINPWQSYWASSAIWDHTVTCHPTQVSRERAPP